MNVLAAATYDELAEGKCPHPESDGQHCGHWWDCGSCCWCGFDGGGEDCDCERHTAEREARDG